MTKKLLARILLLSGLVLLLLLFAWEAFSEELSVVEVRRNIPLSDDEPIYQDYYINSGTVDGLKVNLVVSATRKISVKDATGTQSYGEMMVPVGQLKVIFAGDKFAVAREYKLLLRDDQPMLEQTGIMIGDKIELKSSFVDTHKLSGRKPKQAVAKPNPTLTPVPAASPAVAQAPANTPAPAAPEKELPTAAKADKKAELKKDETPQEKSEEKTTDQPHEDSNEISGEMQKTASAEGTFN